MNSQILRKSIKGNSSLSTQRLSAELGVAQKTVVRQQKAIDWLDIPHNFTENQANQRIETYRKLLESRRDYRFIRQVVTSMVNKNGYSC